MAFIDFLETISLTVADYFNLPSKTQSKIIVTFKTYYGCKNIRSIYE